MSVPELAPQTALQPGIKMTRHNGQRQNGPRRGQDPLLRISRKEPGMRAAPLASLRAHRDADAHRARAPGAVRGGGGDAARAHAARAAERVHAEAEAVTTPPP